MALPNAYAQYNNSKVLTASPAELTLMLYDGAIKFCNIAELDSSIVKHQRQFCGRSCQYFAVIILCIGIG